MAIFSRFYFDTVGLPSSLSSKAQQKKYKDAVAAVLGRFYQLQGHEIEYGAVTGMLLRDEQFDPDAQGFNGAIVDAVQRLNEEYPDVNGNDQPYTKILQ